MLVIDDQEDLAELLAEYLQDDFDITVRSNPSDGKRLVEEQTFDVIISDLNMPGVSGFEILEQAKTSQPNTPVFVMTGISRTDPDSQKALKNGATDVITKPFRDLQTLLRTIKDALTS